jgi:apolipoprotein N-acyltransferase
LQIFYSKLNQDRPNFLLTKQVFFPFVGGILMGLAPAPNNFWWLAWIALVPLWLSIFNFKNSLPQTILISLAWGFGYYSLALFWITGVHPMTWMGVPWLASLSIAIFCWLFISFWGAVLVVTWSVLMTIITKRINSLFFTKNLSDVCLKVLLGVTLWCSLETLWSCSPLWWTSLASTQSPNNLIILQLGKISGSSTITLGIVTFNGLLAEAILIRNKITKLYSKKLLFLLALLVVTTWHLLGFWLYQYPVELDNRQAIKIGIIQGNIPNEIKLSPKGWRKAIEGYTTGYQKLVKQGVDIVLTPETALPFYWDNILNNQTSFYQAVLAEEVPAWIGAFGRKGNSYTNSLFILTPTGETYSHYDKSKLVPLGEYIPFESVLGNIIDRLSPLDAHLVPGKPHQIFDTPWGRAIAGICYESAFSEHFRRQAKQRGEYIITASNNAHYSSAMPAQHHALDVMRAIETDKWAARATNTGYSAIVDPRGHTLWRSQMNQYAIYADNIYRRQTKTLYVKWGDWLTLLLLGLSAVCLWQKKTR